MRFGPSNPQRWSWGVPGGALQDVGPVPWELGYLAWSTEESSGGNHEEAFDDVGLLSNRQRRHSPLGEDSPAELEASTAVAEPGVHKIGGRSVATTQRDTHLTPRFLRPAANRGP